MEMIVENECGSGIWHKLERVETVKGKQEHIVVV